jgi:hypothetical protein
MISVGFMKMFQVFTSIIDTLSFADYFCMSERFLWSDWFIGRLELM